MCQTTESAFAVLHAAGILVQSVNYATAKANPFVWYRIPIYLRHTSRVGWNEAVGLSLQLGSVRLDSLSLPAA